MAVLVTCMVRRGSHVPSPKPQNYLKYLRYIHKQKIYFEYTLSVRYPIGIPPSRRTVTIAERGTELPPFGKVLLPLPPGCWMPTNAVLRSGDQVMPVISHSFGPVRKRRISPCCGVAHQHLIVAHAREIALVFVIAVGLNPQHSLAVKGQAVGGIEHVACVDVGGSCLCRRRAHRGFLQARKCPNRMQLAPWSPIDQAPSARFGRSGFCAVGWRGLRRVSSPPAFGFRPRFLLLVRAT